MSMYNFAQHVSIELSFWMSWAVVWRPGWSDISPGSHSSTRCLGIQAPSSTNLWVILTSLSFALYSSWLHLLPLLKSSCLTSGQHVHRRAVGRAFQESRTTWQMQGSRKAHGLFGKQQGAQSDWRRFQWEKRGSYHCQNRLEVIGRDLNVSQEAWTSFLWRQYGVAENAVFWITPNASKIPTLKCELTALRNGQVLKTKVWPVSD